MLVVLPQSEGKIYLSLYILAKPRNADMIPQTFCNFSHLW